MGGGGLCRVLNTPFLWSVLHKDTTSGMTQERALTVPLVRENTQIFSCILVLCGKFKAAHNYCVCVYHALLLISVKWKRASKHYLSEEDIAPEIAPHTGKFYLFHGITENCISCM